MRAAARHPPAATGRWGSRAQHGCCHQASKAPSALAVAAAAAAGGPSCSNSPLLAQSQSSGCIALGTLKGGRECRMAPASARTPATSNAATVACLRHPCCCCDCVLAAAGCTVAAGISAAAVRAAPLAGMETAPQSGRARPGGLAEDEESTSPALASRIWIARRRPPRRRSPAGRRVWSTSCFSCLRYIRLPVTRALPVPLQGRLLRVEQVHHRSDELAAGLLQL